MARPVVAQDHIVLLLDQDEFENLPSWLTDNFNILEGGTHTGGSSRNKLIIFKDGSYLELFNWIKKPVEFLDWADKKPGLIDFALTTLAPGTAQENYIAISESLQSGADGGLGATYDHPRSGGRQRADGTEIKWETTRVMYNEGSNIPDASFFPTKRLDIPFFCHDITDRSSRVPSHDESITTHPCGAIGIDSVKIMVPQASIDHYLTLYRSILGVTEKWYMDEMHEEYAAFEITTPGPHKSRSCISIYEYPEEGSEEVYDAKGNRIDKRVHDRAWLGTRGVGIRGLTLTTDEGDKTGHDVGRFATDGIGNTVTLKGWMNRPNRPRSE